MAASADAPEMAEPQVPPVDSDPRVTRLRTLSMSEVAMTYVDEYRAGACNIGPAEIARRRGGGHAGAAATILLGAALVWTDAPTASRLLLFLPAAVGAAGYIQAATRFCADYGWRGVFNFGDAGHDRVESVANAKARAADRRRALRIGGASALVGVLAVLISLAF